MLKKFAFAAASLALAFGTPSVAADKPVVEEIHDYGMVEEPGYGADMGPMNPFAGLEEFALKKPIINLPKPDPARLAIAEQIAGAIYADGTSTRIFTHMRTDLFQPVFDRFWTMKAKEAAELFGFEGDMPKGKKKNETLGQAMSKDDPNAKERLEAFVTVYLDLLGTMSGAIEPDLRGAMARDYARRYDVAQLTDMANFFATPTGAMLARDYWTQSMSLDIIQTSLMVWPKMMKAVPDFAERMKKADAHLPPAPKGSFFSKRDNEAYDDDAYLPECAKDGDESDCTDADWDAAAAAMPAINTVPYPTTIPAPLAPSGLLDGDTGSEPWYLEENWSDADLEKYDAANAAYRDHEATADSLYVGVLDAEDAAIKAARDKYKKQGWKPAPPKD